MVDTIKFSEMTPGGDLANNEKTPGLLGGANVLFNNPWTFLPPGTTADRPAPSAAINYRLRFNTDDQLYEYYDAVLGAWTQLQESAFTVGPFITYEADASLPDAQNLGLLANGILKQTITLGSATLDIAVNGVDYYGPGYTGYIDAPAGFKDISGNITLNLLTAGASAVNYPQLSNSISGQGPSISAKGLDANIAFTIASKGTGQIGWVTGALTQPILIYSGTSSQHLTRFNMSDTAADRLVTWQDSSGTVAWLTDIPAGSPSALTKTDDTNVTITLGGTPATALLQAVSLTMGWTGTLSGARGGTGVANTGLSINLGSATTGYLLTSDSSGNATWQVPDYLSNAVLLNPSGNQTITGFGLILNAGPIIVGTTAGSGTPGSIQLYNAAASVGGFALTNTAVSTYSTILTNSSVAQLTTITFPDPGSGSASVAYTSQLVTPASLTKTDDTNVTLTLGGSPSTALVNAASLTLGWTGQLSVARGGTGISSFGTGVATALGQNVTGSGGIVLATAPTLTQVAFSTTSGIIGTTTNDNAAAGSVGEYVSDSVSFGAPVALTTDTAANITSISLTAGDWDVWGMVGLVGAAGTLLQYCAGWSSQTSATNPGNDLVAQTVYSASGVAVFASARPSFTIQQARISLSGTTTIYLSAQAGFSVDTCSAFGNIRARRRR